MISLFLSFWIISSSIEALFWEEWNNIEESFVSSKFKLSILLFSFFNSFTGINESIVSNKSFDIHSCRVKLSLFKFWKFNFCSISSFIIFSSFYSLYFFKPKYNFELKYSSSSMLDEDKCFDIFIFFLTFLFMLNIFIFLTLFLNKFSQSDNFVKIKLMKF